MTGAAADLARVSLRALGRTAFAAGGRPLGCIETVAWRRQEWVEGWCEALDSCLRASPANAFPRFPVKPRTGAAWGDLEDRVLAAAWARRIPARALAPHLGRSVHGLYERARLIRAAARRPRAPAGEADADTDSGQAAA